jgi:uncharacterized protein (TIGR03435 family)
VSVRQLSGALAFILVAIGVLDAQAPRAFEVTSVKRNTTNGVGVPPVVAVTGQRLSAPFVTVRELIRVAYGLNENQVVGGPGWLVSDRYEVGATIPAGASLDAVREMLRTLLAERFSLLAHPEKRDLPVYTLTSTGQLGPRIHPSGPECAPMTSPSGIPAPPPPPPPPAGAGPMTILGMPPGSKCGTAIMRGHISARDIVFEAFTFLLMRELGRPVLDKTNLTGHYDLDLSYLPDSGPMTINGTAINADAPPLSTAIREQLGLKLDSTRAPVDVIVIDRASPPTGN